MLGEKLTGKAFQLDADLIDAFGLLGAELGDHRAAMRQHLDQSLGLELAQRLAHERAADAGHLTQRAFGQPLARS